MLARNELQWVLKKNKKNVTAEESKCFLRSVRAWKNSGRRGSIVSL